jgi:hypothetical protein
MINIEPANLIGKTIEEAFFIGGLNQKVELRFTDGTKAIIEHAWTEDDISGDRIDLDHLEINYGV